MVDDFHLLRIVAAKGDLIVEPLELLVELLASLLVRIVGESLPNTTSGQWHWPHWLALAVVVIGLGLVIWLAQRRPGKTRT